MPDSNEVLNILAQRAAEDILRGQEAGKKVNVAVTARQYRIDRKRITRRIKGVRPRTSRISANRRLLVV
jgi:hypothetical protein